MKAILVIDMPKIDENTKNGCRNCRYARKMMTLSEQYLCSITEQSAYVYEMKCPLKPLEENYISIEWLKHNIPFQSMSVRIALLSMLDSWESEKGKK